MNQNFKVIPAVFVAILDGNKTLLLKRQNTGFMDGFYDAPSGHLERDEEIKEGACREVEEESGLIVKPEDLVLFHVYQSNEKLAPYLGLMFRTNKWQGKPEIKEPHKCSDMGWFELDNLPDVSLLVRDAFNNIKGSGVTFRRYSAAELDEFRSRQ